ncbi:MAG: hypothetical protein ABSG73_00470 [Candidatus Aminicenantales bacterium]
MKKPPRSLPPVFLSLTLLVLFTAVPSGASENKASFRAGISFEHFSRTVEDKVRLSKSSADLIMARAEIEPRPGLVFDLEAGFSLSNFNGLHFVHLPISIDYEAGAVTGLLIGAGVRAGLLRLGDFDIEGVGRFVYSPGSTKTWTLEGFSVPGTSRGGPTWMRASVGPRISYIFPGKFVPFLSILGSWFWGNFKLDETLSDLYGQETKKIRGKSLVEISLGADYKVSDRISLRAEAGFLPYAGGIDGTVSAGCLFFF